MVSSKSSHPIEDSVVPDQSTGISNILILLVVCISLVLNVASIYLLVGNSVGLNALSDPLGIKKSILEVEYTKVGGKANYELLVQAQMIQFKSNLPQLKEFIKSQWGVTPAKGTDTQTPSTQAKVLDPVKVEKLKESAAYEGTKDALITVIEYSDMECPFCLKQYHDTQLKEKLLAQYGSGVNFVFKNNLWVKHPGTEAKAIGALCAQKVGGDNAYIQYYNAIMAGSIDGRNVYPVSDLPNLAKTLRLDMTKWQSCVNNRETASLFASQTSEAAGFNLRGTPGTLIINNKTGKYDTIEGAYPYEAFAAKIDELSK